MIGSVFGVASSRSDATYAHSMKGCTLLLCVAHAAALGTLAPSKDGLLTWLGDGVANDAIYLKPSIACGGTFGVFARRAIAPGERLAIIPGHACMASRDACDDAHGSFGARCRAFLAAAPADISREGTVLAALLLHTRSGGAEAAASRARWGPLVDALPWDDRAHPLERALVDGDEASFPAGEASLSRARVAALAARALVGDDVASHAESVCALAMVRSRAFDLSGFWSHRHMPGGARRIREIMASGEKLPDTGADGAGRRFVLVPLADMFNHPSLTALRGLSDMDGGARFSGGQVTDACIAWSACFSASGDGAVSIHAPPDKSGVREGEELWNWYCNTGSGAETREGRDAEGRAFVAKYGFSPLS